jgi:hypothetical protein
MPKAQQYLTATAAARLAGLSPPAMSRRLKAGELTWYRDPSDHRMRLIDADELQQYLKVTPNTEREGVPTN